MQINRSRAMGATAPDMTQRRPVARTRAQIAAALVGAVFLVVGIAGFIPGITTHYGDMSFAGHDSMAKLLGIFMVSVLHNLVHLAFGLVGLAMSRTFNAARTYLIGGGIIYLALWVYGLATDDMSNANFVPVNNADDWLHLILGIGMIGLGVILGRRAVESHSRP
ncbi:MAG: hypothetical protein JWM76_370 [Pseudonocardiales bacterium]|nr:hypothetical protein [Pseudonocardiales bacterium]